MRCSGHAVRGSPPTHSSRHTGRDSCHAWPANNVEDDIGQQVRAEVVPGTGCCACHQCTTRSIRSFTVESGVASSFDAGDGHTGHVHSRTYLPTHLHHRLAQSIIGTWTFVNSRCVCRYTHRTSTCVQTHLLSDRLGGSITRVGPQERSHQAAHLC